MLIRRPYVMVVIDHPKADQADDVIIELAGLLGAARIWEDFLERVEAGFSGATWASHRVYFELFGSETMEKMEETIRDIVYKMFGDEAIVQAHLMERVRFIHPDSGSQGKSPD